MPVPSYLKAQELLSLAVIFIAAGFLIYAGIEDSLHHTDNHADQNGSASFDDNVTSSTVPAYTMSPAQNATEPSYDCSNSALYYASLSMMATGFAWLWANTLSCIVAARSENNNHNRRGGYWSVSGSRSSNGSRSSYSSDSDDDNNVVPNAVIVDNGTANADNVNAADANASENTPLLASTTVPNLG